MGDLLSFIRKSRRAAASQAAPEPPAPPFLPAAPPSPAPAWPLNPMVGALVLSAALTTCAAAMAADMFTLPGQCAVAAFDVWRV